jgi:hypothetical protein
MDGMCYMPLSLACWGLAWGWLDTSAHATSMQHSLAYPTTHHCSRRHPPTPMLLTIGSALQHTAAGKCGWLLGDPMGGSKLALVRCHPFIDKRVSQRGCQQGAMHDIISVGWPLTMNSSTVLVRLPVSYRSASH